MRALFASGMLLLLAACGFQPMYAPVGGGQAIGPVEISTIEGKSGHILKTELDRILAVENNGSQPAQLQITLKEDIQSIGLRRDESSTRADLVLTANYIFSPANGGRPIRGSVVTTVSYDIPTAAFAAISAQDDARERAAETMAERFRAELALRLAQVRDEQQHGQ
ncbi:MAG TPA: LPS assembly lipoprotein LptE [Vitreimonas sp.]|jgi:LPS-assembly lipoprotein|nr:LPS assembly lipoprotein LptE [Vitreimonas sp.]